MPTTLGFPYPTDTDLVQNVDEAIEALATATENAILRVGSAWRIMAASNAIASAGYSVLPQAADKAAAQAAIVKTDAASGLLVTVTGSVALSAGGAQRALVGARIGGVDFDLGVVFMMGINTRTTFAAQRVLTGISAGAKTVDPVFKVPAGTLTFYINDDFLTVTVREVA